MILSMEVYIEEIRYFIDIWSPKRVAKLISISLTLSPTNLDES